MRLDKILRSSLIFWTLFIGIGALGGAIMLWSDPSGKAYGMEESLRMFQEKMPFADIFFKDFILSGFALLIVNGLTQFTAAALLFKKHRLADYTTLICGIILMLWICVEWYAWGPNFLSNIYFAFGVIETATSAVLIVRHNRRSNS